MDDKTLAILTIVAVVVGPILALWMQRILDQYREVRNRKLWVFRTLMTFRATPLNPNFVQALNVIEVDFSSSSTMDKEVRKAWKIFRDHLSSFNKASDPAEKSRELTANLLVAMSRCLGYSFDEVDINKGAYYPIGLENVELEQHQIRRQTLELLEGKRRIPVAVLEEKFPDLAPDHFRQLPRP